MKKNNIYNKAAWALKSPIDIISTIKAPEIYFIDHLYVPVYLKTFKDIHFL